MFAVAVGLDMLVRPAEEGQTVLIGRPDLAEKGREQQKQNDTEVPDGG